MSLYRIEWSETWLRTITADIDEDTMRDTLDVPVGPISVDAMTKYLEDNCNEGYEFHPNTTPGYAYESGDEFLSLNVDDIAAPPDLSGLDEFTSHEATS